MPAIKVDQQTASELAAALRESQDKFQALLEAAPVAVVIVDSQGRIVLVNAKTEMIFGYNRLELIGQTLEILLPERFRQAQLKFLPSPAPVAELRPGRYPRRAIDPSNEC